MEAIDNNGKMKISTYVEWAMGTLLSGIIFAASKIGSLDAIGIFTNLAEIGIFSVVLYFLERLRKRLKEDEVG